MAAAPSVSHETAPGKQCRMRVVGYLHGSGGQRVLRQSAMQPRVPSPDECASPLVARCADGCGRVDVWHCSNHRESKCSPCALRYRRRVRRVAEDGLLRRSPGGPVSPPLMSASWAHGRSGQPPAHMYLLTLTAPSDRPHQRFIPGRRGRHGACGCWSDNLAVWNAGASGCWNRLRTSMSREWSVDYFRATEVQDGHRGGSGRGALHHHVLLVVSEPVSVDRLHELATAAGYGCVMDLEPLEPGSRKAARYVAKYVTKSADQREIVPWSRESVDRQTGEITEDHRPTFRTWSASRSWGLTMAECVAAAKRAVTPGSWQQTAQSPGSPEASNGATQLRDGARPPT